MSSNQSEKLLNTVQELRRHLQEFPTAQANFKSIQRYWLPNTLFPADEHMLQQALNVLINAGEISVQQKDDGVISYRCNENAVVIKRRA